MYIAKKQLSVEPFTPELDQPTMAVVALRSRCPLRSSRAACFECRQWPSKIAPDFVLELTREFSCRDNARAGTRTGHDICLAHPSRGSARRVSLVRLPR